MKLEAIPFQTIDVLDGELVSERRDGRSFALAPGVSCVVDGDGAHRSSSPRGARLLNVD